MRMLKTGVDLSELRGSGSRHPWETARASAIERILAAAHVRPKAVLDYGCGDGFTGEKVRSALGAERLVGVDIHLTEARCQAQAKAGVTYTNDWRSTAGSTFDLCLLCDVLEHVEDDRALLGVVCERLQAGAHVLITVPAFQVLFANHDHALRHFRRYTLGQIEQVAADAGLEVEASGYLFGSLLPGRGASKLLEVLKPKAAVEDFGIGAWNGSKPLTAALETWLAWDNALLLGLAARGIKLPGLSAWVLCKQRFAR